MRNKPLTHKVVTQLSAAVATYSAEELAAEKLLRGGAVVLHENRAPNRWERRRDKALAKKQKTGKPDRLPIPINPESDKESSD